MINWKHLALAAGVSALLMMGCCMAAGAEEAGGTNESSVNAEVLSEGTRETAAWENTLNILLVGSDRRHDGWYGNSDTMILVTLNDSKEQISMVSFMRDLAAAIPGYGTQKLNAANAAGGPQLLIETLENNFGVHIDYYAEGDFHSVVDIIDAFGGVDIVQSAAEVKVTNDYIHSLCSDWGLSADAYYVSESTTHLNGLQALAYMRDRYVGNDYERTNRQRKVLEQLMKSVDLTDMKGMMGMMSTIASSLDTNISLTTLISLAGYLPKINEYTLVTDRIPYDDLHSYSGEMLVPSQPSTNDRLRAAIYGE